MKRFVLMLLVTTSLVACRPSPNATPARERTDSFDALSAIGPEMLAAFDEGPLPRNAGDFAVRIFYIPTFDHPFMIRHSYSKAGASNRAVVLSGAGGYDPGTKCFASTTESSYAQVERPMFRIGQGRILEVASG